MSGFGNSTLPSDTGYVQDGYDPTPDPSTEPWFVDPSNFVLTDDDLGFFNETNEDAGQTSQQTAPIVDLTQDHPNTLPDQPQRAQNNVSVDQTTTQNGLQQVPSSLGHPPVLQGQGAQLPNNTSAPAPRITGLTPPWQTVPKGEKPRTDGDKLNRPVWKKSTRNNPLQHPDCTQLVRLSEDGSLLWFEEVQKVWMPAIYHRNVRTTLLNIASENGRYQYQNARARGNAADDQTAYHPEHALWSSDQSSWVHIRDEVLFMLEKKNYSGKYDNQVLQWMLLDNKIVLDDGAWPIRLLPDLPYTLSSRVEGFALLAYKRLDSRLQDRDLWGRMPRETRLTKGKKRDMGTVTAVTNVWARWSWSQGIPVWGGHSGKEDFLRERLNLTANPSIVQTNSTKGFLRPVSDIELRQFNKSVNDKKKRKAEEAKLDAEQENSPAVKVQKTQTSGTETVTPAPANQPSATSQPTPGPSQPVPVTSGNMQRTTLQTPTPEQPSNSPNSILNGNAQNPRSSTPGSQFRHGTKRRHDETLDPRLSLQPHASTDSRPRKIRLSDADIDALRANKIERTPAEIAAFRAEMKRLREARDKVQHGPMRQPVSGSSSQGISATQQGPRSRAPAPTSPSLPTQGRKRGHEDLEDDTTKPISKRPRTSYPEDISESQRRTSQSIRPSNAGAKAVSRPHTIARPPAAYEQQQRSALYSRYGILSNTNLPHTPQTASGYGQSYQELSPYSSYGTRSNATSSGVYAQGNGSPSLPPGYYGTTQPSGLQGNNRRTGAEQFGDDGSYNEGSSQQPAAGNNHGSSIPSPSYTPAAPVTGTNGYQEASSADHPAAGPSRAPKHSATQRYSPYGRPTRGAADPEIVNLDPRQQDIDQATSNPAGFVPPPSSSPGPGTSPPEQPPYAPEDPIINLADVYQYQYLNLPPSTPLSTEPEPPTGAPEPEPESEPEMAPEALAQIQTFNAETPWPGGYAPEAYAYEEDPYGGWNGVLEFEY